ncbi:MAG: tRNA (adenosine(37)-N6)-threonylcarbamoyltransferase complex dimerization subunit type 1 TsaB [Xanthomonadaceae bacterium]|nr:tRNA (adenosine(37)-N6)-threonylcarbamoyltransferase complex dimerization subunit type 1 TsaB [Xanthomonadaceae bacterium]
MNLLAIETATESCSVALLCGDTLRDVSELAPRRHAERVLPMAEQLLAEAGLSRRQLDVIAVGRGPGAFTGVRLAVSLAQGLALALDIPVVPVSSLAALAMEAPIDAPRILALLDARMGELYAGAFARTPDGSVTALGDEHVGAAAEIELPPDAGWWVVGSGCKAYAGLLALRLAAPRGSDGDRHPQARHVARLGALRYAAGAAVAPELALPVYLRDKVALTLAERMR